MRLFAGLGAPADVVRTLDEAIAPLRSRHDRLRWTPPAQWHVTIAFLGSVSRPVEQVAEALSVAAQKAPETIRLDLFLPGHFGGRVLWIGIADRPEGAVAALGEAAQEALAAADLPVDRKPVHPHLTLARHRDRGARSRGELRALVDEVPAVTAGWSVSDIGLYASVPQGHGEPNRYELQAAIPLGR
jgi:RNA 2',3'-cyclic 3'-phosphodiesterase